MAATERDVPQGFVEFAENASAILQVITFFVFGALIVATGFDHSIPPLVVFVLFALLVARPVGGDALLRPHRHAAAAEAVHGLVRAEGRRLDALRPLRPQVARSTTASLIFDVAAIAIIASIVAHGLTDTVGARWMARRMGLDRSS